VITWIEHIDQRLPRTSQALGHDSETPGLLAAGGDLTTERLIEAYSHGVFPWYQEGQPVLWWSPDPRMVLPVAEFKPSRSLRKTIARFATSSDCELRTDTCRRQVLQACASVQRAGQRGTWITRDMVAAYCAWPAVHSFETWIAGELVGGLYGVSLGRMFFGESMFSRRTDSSKIALAALVCFCRANGIGLIDCQQRTEHLRSMGAREVTRTVFEELMAPYLREAPVTNWTYDRSLWSRLR